MRPLLIVLLLTPLVAPAADLRERIAAAPSGATVDVGQGTHQGPLVLDKPIHLRGEPGARIVGNGLASVISVSGDDVTVEGLHIVRSGKSLDDDHAGIFITGERAVIRGNTIGECLHGIYLKEANGCQVSGNTIQGLQVAGAPITDVVATGIKPESAADMCSVTPSQAQRGNGIHLWNSSGSRIEDNTIADTRDGIYFSFSNDTVVVGNTILRARYGLHYMYSDHNIFERNRFEESAAGAAVMYSEGLFVRGNTFTHNAGHRSYGILVQSVDTTTFIGNTVARNTVGLYMENSNGNTLLDNAIERNYVGVRLSSSSFDNAFSGNRFSGNMHPVETDRDSAGNHWAIDGRGNHWRDARPVDLDGDGAGDLPHRQTDLLGQHRRAFPLAGLLTESPFLRLLSFVHARAKLPGVPAIEDPAPLLNTASK